MRRTNGPKDGTGKSALDLWGNLLFDKREESTALSIPQPLANIGLCCFPETEMKISLKDLRECKIKTTEKLAKVVGFLFLKLAKVAYKVTSDFKAQ